MDNHDILFVIFDILAADEDAQSLVNCSNVNKLMYRTYRSYSKYTKLPCVRIYKIVVSPSIDRFKRELLELILVKTQISPMISDIYNLVRFLRMTDHNVNMNGCLDRLIPDNLEGTGNDMDYKPGALLPSLIASFVEWLNRWSCNNVIIRVSVPDDVGLPDIPEEAWRMLEEPLDEFYRLAFMAKAPMLTDDEKNDKHVAFRSYDLYSRSNSENNEKMTLYLNKLKTVYQLIN